MPLFHIIFFGGYGQVSLVIFLGLSAKRSRRTWNEGNPRFFLTYFFSKWVKLQFSRMETVDFQVFWKPAAGPWRRERLQEKFGSFERFAWKREE